MVLSSCVQGYNRPNAYIAAQGNYFLLPMVYHHSHITLTGPLRNTIGDFWLMIWQYKLRSVIMLTETVEAGRVTWLWLLNFAS